MSDSAATSGDDFNSGTFYDGSTDVHARTGSEGVPGAILADRPEPAEAVVVSPSDLASSGADLAAPGLAPNQLRGATPTGDGASGPDAAPSPNAPSTADLQELLDSLWGLHVDDVERLGGGKVRILLRARGTDDANVDVFFHELDVREADRG